MNTITRFIGGPGRTNTTILAEMLAKHQPVAVLNEVNIVRRLFEFKSAVIWKSLFYEERTVNTMVASMFKENAWADINQARKNIWKYCHIDTNPYEMREQILKLENEIQQNLDSFHGKAHKIIDEYLKVIGIWTNEKSIILKQPAIETYLAKIAMHDDNPEAWRVVFTTKDLFDVATSWCRDQTISGQDYHDSLDELQKHIIDGCLAVRLLPAKSVLFVDDKSLYDNPEEVIKQVCSFFGVDFEPSALLLYDRKKRRQKEGLTDAVVERYRSRINWLRKSANIMLDRDVW